MVRKLVLINSIGATWSLNAIFLQARLVVSILSCAHREIVMRLHHHHRRVLSVKLMREHMARVASSLRSKDTLDFFNSLLLLLMSLSEPLEYALLILLQSSRLAVFLADLDDLLLDHLVLMLASLCPFLGCDLLRALSNAQLCGLDLSLSLLNLFQISCILLLPSLEQRLHLFLNSNGILLTHLSQILLALHRSRLGHI